MFLHNTNHGIFGDVIGSSGGRLRALGGVAAALTNCGLGRCGLLSLSSREFPETSSDCLAPHAQKLFARRREFADAPRYVIKSPTGEGRIRRGTDQPLPTWWRSGMFRRVVCMLPQKNLSGSPRTAAKFDAAVRRVMAILRCSLGYDGFLRGFAHCEVGKAHLRMGCHSRGDGFIGFDISESFRNRKLWMARR
jgi:hypothetical protein